MKCSEYKVSVVRECEVEYKGKLLTPKNVSDFWHSEIEKSAWYDGEKEMVVSILISAKNHIKGYNLISIGSATASLIEPREVFRPAIIGGAIALILCHNHPSGDSIPSSEDIRVTKNMIEAGKILDIKILDHVIIGKPNENNVGFTTMREGGYLEF